MDLYPKTLTEILFFSLFFLSSVNNVAIASSEAKESYVQGAMHFENKKYNDAIEHLENAIKLEPENAAYQHLLAVSYGREAENANWFRAVDLAQRTLIHLQIASELDRNNVEILDDLMDYYREAPGFLGGDAKKADEIESLIEKINKNEVESTKIE